MRKKELEEISYLRRQGLKNPYRVKNLIKEAIKFHKLNLTGLVVFTETASGNYVVTPIIAAMAGAKVYAITADSIYGRARDIKNFTYKFADFCGVKDKIKTIFRKQKEIIKQADIITNLGFVRPINKKFISNLKKTAVIPLMYETWEFRDGDIDLKASQERNILVLGTDEHHPKLKIMGYLGPLALKKILDLGLEGTKLRIIVITDEIFGPPIIKYLRKNNIKVVNTFTKIKNADALIVAYQKKPKIIIGKDGLITARKLKQISPFISIIQLCGNGIIDRDSLGEEDILYIPEVAPRRGFTSWTLADLGPHPVIELHTAGLKVGEVMARARLVGKNIEEAKTFALKYSSAQDFSSK